MTCDQAISELLPPYAMGSATDLERQQVEQHVKTCADCARQLDDIQLTLADLALTAPAHEPPSSLRSRTLAAIAMADPGELAQSEHPTPTATSAWSTRRRWHVPGASWPVAVAASLALIFAGVSGALLDRVNDLERRLDREPAQQQARPEAEGPTLIGQQVSQLTSSGPLERSNLIVASSKTTGAAVLVIRDLPDPPKGRSWQAWTIDGAGKKRSIDVIDRGGELVVINLELVAGGRRIDAVAITPEPSGGSRQPTGVPVAHGQLV